MVRNQPEYGAKWVRSKKAGIETDTWLTGYPRSQDPAPHTNLFKGANPFKVLWPMPMAVAHIQLHRSCTTYI